MDVPIIAGAVAVAVALARVVYWVFLRRAAQRILSEAQSRAAKNLEEAERSANTKIREAEIAAK